LILGLSERGEITVDVAGADLDGLPGIICQAIALKLIQDEKFQAEVMDPGVSGTVYLIAKPQKWRNNQGQTTITEE